MKKLIIFLFLVLFFLPLKVSAIEISASSYVLMDMNTNRVLLGKNINERKLIASITKIMTSLIAIESNRLDETVVVDDSILKSYGSGIYIQIGEELTLRDLLYGLMLRSGNDAALMISNFISGSEEAFVKKMNEKAKEIGMKNTTFVNASGLDEDGGNYSTSYDMAILTSYAMGYDEYKKIVSTEKYTLKTNYKTYIWYNKNKLLQLDYITGGKTGYTEKARRTLVSTAFLNDLNLVVVTLNDPNDWVDHKKLYEYAFKNYKAYKILDKNNYQVNDDNYYKDRLYIKNDLTMALREDEKDKIINNIEIKKVSNYKNGDKVGVNLIYLDNKLIKSENIYVLKEKEVKKESFWDKILNFFKNFKW